MPIDPRMLRMAKRLSHPDHFLVPVSGQDAFALASTIILDRAKLQAQAETIRRLREALEHVRDHRDVLGDAISTLVDVRMVASDALADRPAAKAKVL